MSDGWVWGRATVLASRCALPTSTPEVRTFRASFRGDGDVVSSGSSPTDQPVLAAAPRPPPAATPPSATAPYSRAAIPAHARPEPIGRETSHRRQQLTAAPGAGSNRRLTVPVEEDGEPAQRLVDPFKRIRVAKTEEAFCALAEVDTG